MDIEVQRKIKTVLETAMVLNPISVRLVINETVGHLNNEDLKTFFAGNNSTAFQETDYRFYEIMKSQNPIEIVSVEQSRILSALNITKASALFYPIRSEYGYHGCFWVCYHAADYSRRTVELYSNFFEWMECLLLSALQNDFGVQMVANRYSDLLELVKSPALIVVYPDLMTVSNPAFESLKNKDSIFALVRDHPEKLDEIEAISEFYSVEVREVSFPGRKEGKLFLFHESGHEGGLVCISNDELQYYQMIIAQIAGNIELLESAGSFSLLQYNFKTTIDGCMARINTLLRHEKKHYAEYVDPEQHTFEVIIVRDIVGSVINDLKPIARKKKITLEFDDGKIEGNVSSGNAIGDSWLLTLSVFNLVSNAIKHSKPDGKSIQIELAFRVNDWMLRVEDFGIGISPLDMERILTEHEEDKLNSPEVHGIRLVQYAMRVHKGKLSLKSQLGRGSVFTIEVPYY